MLKKIHWHEWCMMFGAAFFVAGLTDALKRGNTIIFETDVWLQSDKNEVLPPREEPKMIEFTATVGETEPENDELQP